ncbi:MAG: hypothetical protein IKI34_00255 [Eubacterium sp.]|nr:hypothetical protein [Eubacterium sp.]
MCFVAFILIIIVFSFSFAVKGERFSPSPSHIVLNRWTDDNGRIIDIISADIDRDMLIHSNLETPPCTQTQFIIKTNNLKISLFTKGKIIYQNTDKKFSGYGKQIHIIDIGDIKKGSELCLFLSPVKGKGAEIEGNIILASKNDFLLDLLCRNMKIIVLLILLFLFFIGLVITGIIKLIKKKKTAPKFLYLSGCFMILSLIILLRSEIYQFIIPASFSAVILQYLCYPVFFVFLISFILSLLRKKPPFIQGSL